MRTPPYPCLSVFAICVGSMLSGTEFSFSSVCHLIALNECLRLPCGNRNEKQVKVLTITYKMLRICENGYMVCVALAKVFSSSNSISRYLSQFLLFSVRIQLYV